MEYAKMDYTDRPSMTFKLGAPKPNPTTAPPHKEESPPKATDSRFLGTKQSLVLLGRTMHVGEDSSAESFLLPKETSLASSMPRTTPIQSSPGTVPTTLSTSLSRTFSRTSSSNQEPLVDRHSHRREAYSARRRRSLDRHLKNRDEYPAPRQSIVGDTEVEEELDPARLALQDYHSYLDQEKASQTLTNSETEIVCRISVEAPFHQAALKIKKSLSLFRKKSQRTTEQSSETGPLPSFPTSLAPQDAQPQQGTGLPRLVECSNSGGEWTTTPDHNDRSSLQESLTTPETARAASGPVLSTSTSSLVAVIPCKTTRSTSHPRLPRTPRPIASAASTQSIVTQGELFSGRPITKLPSSQSPYPAPGLATSMASRDTSRNSSPSWGVECPTDTFTTVASMDRTSQDTIRDESFRTTVAFPVPHSAGYISSREIDPKKLKPFLGTLPQQPPPTKPPPPVPHPRIRTTDSVERKQQQVSCPPPATLTKGDTETIAAAKVAAPGGEFQTYATVEAEDSVDASDELRLPKRPRTGLRQKVTAFFGDEVSKPSACRATEAGHDAPSTSTFRPISMSSLGHDNNSLFDAIENVLNAACGLDSPSDNHRSPGTSSVASQALSGAVFGSATPQRALSNTMAYTSCAADDANRLAATLNITDPASKAKIHAAFAEREAVAPLLTGHPAICGDLPLQARLGMIKSTTGKASLTAMAGLHVPPLVVGRKRPTQVAVSTRSVSRLASPADAMERRSTGYTTRGLAMVPVMSKGDGDVDSIAAYDRTVDAVWYRFATEAYPGHRRSAVPPLPSLFQSHSTVFMILHSRGRESKTTKYGHLRRFKYEGLPGEIRFNIMEKLLDDTLPGKPVLLNPARQAYPAWPDDAFATLWQALGPLQNVLTSCPRLRADVMAALFMRQAFHVIFSPFVKPITQPLPTVWLNKYVYFMQDLRVELDMTKLGFGQTWDAVGLSTKLLDIGDLVHALVEQLLRRDPHAHPLTKLTIHCRRHFGYRQGQDPRRGDVTFHKSLVGKHEDQTPSAQPDGNAWNHGRLSTTLPPSSNNPYSGHRRHHARGPDRVPFLHEGHMSVANAFHKLTGRVWIVRMVGMSEAWTQKMFNFWPKAEYDLVKEEDRMLHVDRFSPTMHTYVAPGHAIFVDYGMRFGVRRVPPLPDSDPMVGALYDEENDVYLEARSGNILTVDQNGVEVVARAKNPAIPRGDLLPTLGYPPLTVNGCTKIAPSRIPGPPRGRLSPTMQTMRSSTPKKARQLLGFDEADEESGVTPSGSPTLQGDEEDDLLTTPTASRVTSAVLPTAHALLPV